MYERKKILNRYFLTVILSIFILIIGCLIYLFYRVRTLNIFVLLKKIKYDKFFTQILFNENSPIENFMVFSFPNGLWLLSGLLIFGVIWHDCAKRFMLYATAFTTINIIIEIFQYFNFISGTFDIIDLCTLIIFYFIGIFIYFIFLRRKKYEK